jgi:hypothetical protein
VDAGGGMNARREGRIEARSFPHSAGRNKTLFAVAAWWKPSARLRCVFMRSAPVFYRPWLTAMILAFCFAGESIPAFALSWPQKTVMLKASAGVEELEARYRFTNTGKTPVVIQQVESSCGCTTADLERRNYGPGESGEIVARFKIGERVGRQVKTIAVQSSDSKELTTLTLVADIPEILRIRPTFVYWMEGEEPAPKRMTLELLQDTPADDVSVQSSNAVMKLELQEVVKGRKYELIVRPTSTGRYQFSALTINCQFGEHAKSFRAYATIKPVARPAETDREPR